MFKGVLAAFEAATSNVIVVLVCLLATFKPIHSQVNTEGNASAGSQLMPSHSEVNPDKSGQAKAAPQLFANIRLTTNSAESANPRAVVDNEYLYVVWEDTRDGNREVYWQKFDLNNVAPVTIPIRVTSTSDPSFLPSIGIDASGNSYLAWQEGSLYGTIFAAKLNSAGAFVVAPMSVSPGLSLHPDIAAATDGTNWIVYQRMANVSDQQVYIRKGNSSLSQVCLAPMSNTIWGAEKTPVVATDGTNGWVAHYDLGDFFAEYLRLRRYVSPCAVSGQADQNQKYVNPALGFGPSGIWAAAERNGTVYQILGPNSVMQVSDLTGTSSRPRVEPDNTYGYFVWQDNRNGNDDIFISRALGSTDYPDEPVTTHVGSSQNPDIATLLSGDLGKWWVVWQDNRDGNWEIYVAKSEQGTPSIVLVDGANPPQPIANRSFKIYKQEPGGGETLVLDGTTDETGSASMSDSAIDVGDAIRVEVLAHELPSQKENHGMLDNVSHRIFIDNADVASSGPLIVGDVYQGVEDQSIVLDHTTVKYNLLVVVEFDAEVEVLENIKTVFERVANYLFDVSDGQATLGEVAIFDNGIHEDHRHLWNSADVRMNASPNIDLAHASSIGYYSISEACATGTVSLPRCIYSNDVNGNVKLNRTLGINWVADFTEYWWVNYYYPGIQGIAHEMGHYLMFLGDEYRARYPDSPESCTGDNPNHSFGLMDDPFLNEISDDEFGEMSCSEDYIDAGSNFTHQWCRHHEPCWSTFEAAYEGSIWEGNEPCYASATMPFVNIITPEDRASGRPLTGPNNDPRNPDVDCGIAADIWYSDMTDPGVGQVLINVPPQFKNSLQSEQLWAQVKKANTGYILHQGSFDDEGYLLAVGVKAGDTLFIYGNAYDAGLGHVVYKSSELTLDETSFIDTVAAELTQAPDSLPLLIYFLASGPNSMQVKADFQSAFASLPTLLVWDALGNQQTEQMTLVGSSYESVPTIVPGSHGDIQVIASTGEKGGFAIPGHYRWTGADATSKVATASSHDYAVSIYLDTIWNAVSAVSIGHSEYQVPLNGLPDKFVWISSAYSISAYPLTETFAGANSMSIQFTLPEGSEIEASAASIFKWNEISQEWDQLGGVVDTANNEIVAPVISQGVYIVAAPIASSFCGDCDRNDRVDISDVLYIVNYIFAGGPAPIPIAVGDVDCDTKIRITDCVYLINYIFAGGPAPCAACP